jgi:hypothetical protein
MKKRGVAFKKGQITIFIIIGILLVGGISAVIYLQGRAAKEQISVEEAIEESEVTAELTPIDSFVKSCMRNLAEEGLRKAEEYGGYIYLDKLKPNPLSVTEGNAIEYMPNSGINVPYWYHMSSPDICGVGCKWDTGMPPLCRPSARDCINEGPDSVEEQLGRYIGENLRDCLGGFEEVKSIGFEVAELRAPSVTATIRDRNVLIKLQYPLNVIKEGATSQITEFMLTIRTDIKELYTAAYEITDYEMKTCFVEKYMQNHISYYMGLGAGKLPPTSDSTIGEYTMRIWTKEEVKGLLKPILTTGVQLMGVFNTSGFRWPLHQDEGDTYYSTKQGIHDQRVFFPMSKFRDVAVTFTYLPWWEPYLEIKPSSSGGVLMPSNLGNDMGLIGEILGAIAQLYRYEFFYSYSFPIVVDVRKVDHIGREHVFRFGLETNVRANRCFNSNITLKTLRDPYASGLCDEIQATKQARVITKEWAYENQMDVERTLEGVSVSLFAGTTCMKGFSDENGIIDLKYPPMHSGTFKFSKRGYASRIVKVSDITDNMVVTLDKYKELDVTVKNFKMQHDKSLPATPAELREGETAMIAIKKIGEPEVITYDQVLVFKDSSTTDLKLKLLPGTYEIIANYFDNNKVTTPANCAHICEDGLIDDDDCDEADEWLPTTEQDVIIMGGAKFNDAASYWVVSRLDVNEAESAEFKVLSMADPDCIMFDNCIVPACVGYSAELGLLDFYYATYRGKLKPKLIFG